MEDSVYDYNHLGAKFNKVISLLIIIILCFLIFYFVTSAWFGESETAKKVLIIGEVKLEVNADLTFDEEYLQPDKIYDNMPTTIKCKNNTDEAYIKVKLETNYKVKEHNVVFPVLYVSPEDEAESKQTWIYSEQDECYYYVGYISDTKIATFNTGIYVTNDINNIDKNQPIEITITVYAIQRYYKAYSFASEWTFAPNAWKEAIKPYDYEDPPIKSGN